VVLDRRGRLHSGLKVFDDAGVLVYTQVPHLDLPPPHEAAVGITKLPDVARDLARRGFDSFMLECGPDLAFDALRHGIIDKLVVFLAPRIIGGREFPGVGGQGVAVLSDTVEISDWEVQEVGPDLMVTGYVHRDN
jgi:riboflavin biosynthesis pyrimidine reductase